jgi:hypothetical protein
MYLVLNLKPRATLLGLYIKPSEARRGCISHEVHLHFIRSIFRYPERERGLMAPASILRRTRYGVYYTSTEALSLDMHKGYMTMVSDVILSKD